MILLVCSLECSLIVLSGKVVSEPTARALYITRQYHRKTVHEGEDTNIYST